MNKVGYALLGLALVFGAVTLFAKHPFPNIKDTPEVIARPAETIPAPSPTPSGKTVTVTNLDLSKGSTVTLFTDVNEYSANKVIGGIKAANKDKPGKPIYLVLDSPGGSVIDGARIITAMQASKNKVYTVCLQICASMAAMILEYGEERYAVDRSIIMFHPASVGGMIQGELDKVVSRFTFLQRYVDKMDHYTAKRAGVPYPEFKARSNRELWIDAEDALADKLIDKIVLVELQSSVLPADGTSNVLKTKHKLDWTW